MTYDLSDFAATAGAYKTCLVSVPLVLAIVAIDNLARTRGIKVLAAVARARWLVSHSVSDALVSGEGCQPEAYCQPRCSQSPERQSG